MTPLETLQKYGLKTDVKSIRERIEKNDYFHFVLNSDFPMDFRSDEIHNEAQRLRSADLSLLCELAEKGGRFEKAVKNHRDELEPHRCMDEYAFYAVKELTEIITEAEGEPR